MTQIKCTSCGAPQDLTTKDSCNYCGTSISVEKAKEFYIHSHEGELGNFMSIVETAMDATNWNEALIYINKILEKDIQNADAWLYKGIAMVNTSTIGELKVNEAIAYWKNAIKNTTNSEAMSKRVAKEINNVVNIFYPVLENHYKEFATLKNSYAELVSKFSILEKAIEYSTNIDSNIKYSETGYLLCKLVIESPYRYAKDLEYGAFIGAMAATIRRDSYGQYENKSNLKDAEAIKQEINNYRGAILEIQKKYCSLIEKINPNHKYVIEFNTQKAIEAKNNISPFKFLTNPKLLLDKDITFKIKLKGIAIWFNILFWGLIILITIIYNIATSTFFNKLYNTTINSSKEDNSEQVLDICMCLTEPGNSIFMQENGEACNRLISDKIGVEDWAKVNMSEDKITSAKFDELANSCTGLSSNKKDDVELQDNTNSKLNVQEDITNNNQSVTKDIVEDPIKTTGSYQVISDKAYFYSAQDPTTKRKAYLIKGDLIEIKEVSEKWAFGTYTSSNGKETSGWLLKSDIE